MKKIFMAIVEHMHSIVSEMVENRDIRLQQQFVRFIDPRRDENPNDAWMVLRGASAQNATECMIMGKTIILL